MSNDGTDRDRGVDPNPIDGELRQIAADEATQLGITPLADAITKWAATVR